MQNLKLTILFVVLLLYEVVNFSCSSYQPNSIIFLRAFFVILCCVFLLNTILSNKKFRACFVIFISSLAGLLALFNIPVFFFRYYESAIYGFEDFSQFRFLYMPWGFLSNEWVTIILCFLPFPLIGLFLFWNRKYFRYIFLLVTGLLVFNMLISFSRAGILALLLFVGLLNLFFCFNRIISIKKQLLLNGVLIFSLFIFSLCFFGSIHSSIHQTTTHQRSTEGRLKQWEQATDVINYYPFFGTGSKNYALVGSQSQQIDFEKSFSGRVNNTYIQLIVEKGWIGFSLWLLVIGFVIFYSFRQIRQEKDVSDKAINCIVLSAILAVLFREIFFSSLLYNGGILLLFFVLLTFNKIIITRKNTAIVFVMLLYFARYRFVQ